MTKPRRALSVRSKEHNAGLRPPGAAPQGTFDPSAFDEMELGSHPNGAVLPWLRASTAWWPSDSFYGYKYVRNLGQTAIDLELVGAPYSEIGGRRFWTANGSNKYARAAHDAAFDVGPEDDLVVWAVFQADSSPPPNFVGLISKGAVVGQEWSIQFGNADQTVRGVVTDGSSYVYTPEVPWSSGTPVFAMMVLDRSAATLTLHCDRFTSAPTPAHVLGAVGNSAEVRVMRSRQGLGAGRVFDAGVSVGTNIAPSLPYVELIERTLVDRSERYRHGMAWTASTGGTFEGVTLESGQPLTIRSPNVTADYLAPFNFGNSFVFFSSGTDALPVLSPVIDGGEE
jgi:hypothetical protein